MKRIGIIAAVITLLGASGGPPIGTDLQYFVGAWSCSGTFPSSGRAISSTMTFYSDLAGEGVILRQDDIPPNSYHAGALWGPGTARGTLVSVIQYGPPFGVSHFTSTGWSGGALTWQSAPDITPPQRFIFTWIDAATMRVDWEVLRDGRYLIGDTLRCAQVHGTA